jgi:hypothetical protein
MPQLVATAWSSAGAVSPRNAPATSPVPIAERVAAIAGAGFCGLGLIADDLIAIRNTIGFTALCDLIADAGLVHAEIELLERWWIPRGRPGEHPRRPRASVRGRRRLGPGPDQDWFRQRPCHLRTAESRRTAAADHPAAGLLVDAWHVFRAGTSLHELRTGLRLEMIFGVELDDAAPDVVGTLFEDTVDNRLLCGEGSFDLTGLVAVLRDLGFDGPWGVEILSTSYRALPVGQALKLAAESALTVL